MRRTLDWFLSEDKAAGDEVKLPHAGEGVDTHYFKKHGVKHLVTLSWSR